MTEREAIDYLKEWRESIEEDMDVYEKSDDESVPIIAIKSLDLSITALEKQIPKKPISSDCLLCRECCEEIRSYQWKLCPVCEARIDWSEEE